MRIILPTFLVLVALAIFFFFIDPTYSEIRDLQARISVYNQTLSNAEELKRQRDELNQQYRSMSEEDIDRLNKMVPSNIDNIQLILELNEIASEYGTRLENIQINEEENDDFLVEDRPYNSIGIDFNIQGDYDQLVNFVREMEKSLRIVDILSIDFSVVEGVPGATSYSFQVTTYWLR